MTTFLLLSSVAINIVLIVAHKRLNNRCERLEMDLNRECSTNRLWKADYDKLRKENDKMKDKLEMANENTAYWRSECFASRDDI